MIGAPRWRRPGGPRPAAATPTTEKLGALADRPDRPHLDRADAPRRDARGDLDRLVQVLRLDEVEADEDLLGLGERPVGHRDLAAAHPHRGGARHRLQRLRGEAVAALADRLVVLEAIRDRHGGDGLLLAVDEAEVFHQAKSSASKSWRISISASVPGIGFGQRLTHSIASAFDFTFHSQKPATSSFVSANGPSVTMRFAPEKRTRAPLLLDCSPSPASITPALVSSSLYLPIAWSSSWLGILPASESLLAFTITMNLMFISLMFKGPSSRLPGSLLPGRMAKR